MRRLQGFFLGVACCVALSLFVRLADVRAQAPNPAGPPIIATGTIAILVDGRPIAAEPTINLAAGTGIVWSVFDNPAQSRVDITGSLNTVLAATLDQVHNNPFFCNSTNGTSSYTCKLQNRALAAYQLGQTFELLTDAPCNQNCQVNIDTVGPRNIWSRDGLTAAIFPAGIPVWIWYDGKTMRLL